MQTLTEIKALLESRGLSPRKAFGQNFLIDQNLIRKLVDAAGVGRGDVVLEVGPGTGTLTEELLARGCRVVACEIDRGLCALLRERFAERGEAFGLVEGDCLDGKHAINPALEAALEEACGGGEFTLVANLPYGAATPLMLVLLTQMPACRGMHVTIQKEVAERLTAEPGGRDFGPLSVIAQVVGEVRVVAALPPQCFWPRPEVTSAMVSVRRRERPLHADPAGLLVFCNRLFEHRRKQIGSVLGRERPFPDGVDPTERAEALATERIIELFDALGR